MHRECISLIKVKAWISYIKSVWNKYNWHSSVIWKNPDPQKTMDRPSQGVLSSQHDPAVDIFSLYFYDKSMLMWYLIEMISDIGDISQGEF